MSKTLLGILVSFILISPVTAQTPGIATSSGGLLQERHELRKETREQIKDLRTDFRKDVKNTRRDLKTDLKTLRAGIKNASSSEERKNMWDQFKMERETKLDEFKKDVETKRNTLKDLIKDKRQKLEAGLKRIKNEGKKRSVEQIDAEFDAINARRLDHFTEVLNKLHDILGKVSARADEVASSTGKDVTSVHTAIVDAESAIASARTAITAQAGKTYKIDITTESKLKDAVGKVRSALAHDLNAVYDLVKSAREAVRGAAKALKAITHDGPETSTPPASTSTATSS